MSLHKTSQEITGSGRVQIVYDVNGRAKELPFVVGILADLSGHSETPLPQLRRRRFIEIDRETFDRVMSAIRPRLVVDVRDVLRDTDTSLNVCLTFNGLEDFEPDNIVRQIPSLQDTLRTRQKLANLHGTLTRTLEDALREICLDHKELAEMRSEVSCPEAPEGGLLERLALQGSFGSSVYEVTIAKQWIREFFVQYLSGEIQLAPDIASMLSSRLNALDNALSRQVKLIMHEPAFRDLEAAWRELEFLVSRTERSPTLKTKVLNVSRTELSRDLWNAVEFDRSVLFEKIYMEEFDMLGGEPFGAIIAGFFFGRSPEDVELLERLSNIGAASHCPLIAGVKPEMFNCKAFTDVARPQKITSLFKTDIYKKWSAFRDSEDSSFIGLVLPRILLRVPYGDDPAMSGAFNFNERLGGFEHSDYLWGNAAFAFAVRLVQAFHSYGWCAAIRGVEAGGLVSGLPTCEVPADDGSRTRNSPVEVALSDSKESELAGLGFISLCCEKGSDSAVFFRAQSCNRPTAEGASRNTPISAYSAQLEYIFAKSRFAHYLRHMIRDKLEGFDSAKEIEEFLDLEICRQGGYDNLKHTRSSAQFRTG